MPVFTEKVVVENLPIKIDSIHAYDDRLLVGTENGTLLIFQIRDLPDVGESVQMLDSIKGFTRKSVEQLEAIKELDLLIVMSGTLGVTNS